MSKSLNEERIVQSSEMVPRITSFGPFRVLMHARRLERDGAPIPIGSRAFDLLCILVGRAGEVVSKRELLAKAWPDLLVGESNLRYQIAQLRRALDDGQDDERYVTNVPGRGYCFVAPVDHAAARPEQSNPSEAIAHTDFPSWPSRIVGRNVQVLALVEYLSAHRFVTVRGPGSIGKTTVAVALAYKLESEFRDSIRFIDLGMLEDPNLVAVATASALGLLVPVEDPTPRLIEALRDRRLLVIFDNCEHVVEAVAQLAEKIYHQAPRVSIIATSREALGAAGEFVFDLSAIETPPEHPEDRSAIVRISAARLLMESAAVAGYDAAFAAEDADVVARICRRLAARSLT